MTDQITVPRETWDAMLEALRQMIACHDEPTCPAITTATEALTAANAVSEQKGLFVDLIASHGPEFAAEMAATEPQSQGEVEVAGAQSRFKNVAVWTPCSVEHHQMVQLNPNEWDGYETRLVYAHPQATEPASCHQTGVCVRSGLAAENHARLIECARRLVEHADFALGGILSADSKAKDIPSKAVSQVKSRHLAALRDALPAAPEEKQ